MKGFSWDISLNTGRQAGSVCMRNLRSCDGEGSCPAFRGSVLESVAGRGMLARAEVKTFFASGIPNHAGWVLNNLGSRPCGTFRGIAVAHPPAVGETAW
ncbi:MAG: hypothetical protein FLDDKLPJ_00044 [Phycisphaerae bacterium]|nr:hypothetical protein [Phycisphaerae bacterium]